MVQIFKFLGSIVLIKPIRDKIIKGIAIIWNVAAGWQIWQTIGLINGSDEEIDKKKKVIILLVVIVVVFIIFIKMKGFKK